MPGPFELIVIAAIVGVPIAVIAGVVWLLLKNKK
jgi:hypothetical protein